MIETQQAHEMAALYEQDFYEWTQLTAEQLESGRIDEADLEHLAEEIRDMGKAERRELENRLVVLIAHILKWDAQPQRIRLLRLLSDNPSLKAHLASALPEIFELGALLAVKQTNMPRGQFPAVCPYNIDQLLSDYPDLAEEEGFEPPSELPR